MLTKKDPTMPKPTTSAVVRPRGRPRASQTNALQEAPTVIIRPDSKGRITLGKLATGVSGFMVEVGPEGDLHLVPQIEIPAREKWIFENPEVLASIQRGMQQSRDGAVVEADFSQYATDDDADDAEDGEDDA